MAEFDSAGVALYALSYDEPDALRDFAAAHQITYPLLSDPDSAVIRAFGILNTLIDPDDHPWFGIPFPGAFVTDPDGTITHKFFDNNLAVRPGPEQLLRAAQGDSLPDAGHTARATDELTVDVFLDGDSLTRTVQKDLVARFTVPEGRHVYADPAPAGSVAVELLLDDDDRLVTRDLARPASESHRLAGTEESFPVHHGAFQLRLPVTVNGGLVGAATSETITLSGLVRWQVCDDAVCDIPVSKRFELTVPVIQPPPVALGSEEGAAREPNAGAHFRRMRERRA